MPTRPAPALSPQAEAALDAVARLLQPKGSRRPPRLTMDAVVEESGVPRATLYRLFGSRTKLLEQAEARRGTLPPEDDTRQRVLEGLGELVQTLPIHAITLDRVAEHVGVGVVTIHRHFAGRDGLFEAFLSGVSQREQAEAILADRDGPMEEVLGRFVLSALGFVAQHRGLLTMLLASSPEDAEYVQRLRSANRSTRAVLNDYFAAQIGRGRIREAPPLLHTASVMSLVFGASVLGVTEAGDRDALARHIVNTFLYGAAAPGQRRRQQKDKRPVAKRRRPS
jgi:AcrR family transcriptional regulator